MALNFPAVQKLEGRPDKEEEGTIRPREFFWDSIVLYVLFAIIGLSAIDVVVEFIRGSGVQCYLPGNSSSLGKLNLQDYVNDFCSGSLPVTQYFPVFIVVHGILMAVPHYLWLNQVDGYFDAFFKLASDLEQLRDRNSGEYCLKNFVIVQKLETSFATYKQKWIFLMYIFKLLLQWFFTIAGFVVVLVFFTNFTPDFNCPRDSTQTLNRAWPLYNTQVVCVFTSLRLLELVRIADLVLLALVIVCLSWSLVWCISTHPSQLGSSHIAKFSFQSGLPPRYYIQKLHVPKRLKAFRNSLHKLYTAVPWISLHGPRIKTDLDFMMMKLFRTDGSLGYVLKDLQTLKKIKSFNSDERRRFNLHNREQDASLTRGLVSKDIITADIGWEFEKCNDVYASYQPVQISKDLTLPDSIRGAVLGFASRALANNSAIVITFGSPSTGYTDALGRVFARVGSISFNPFYNNQNIPVAVDDGDPSGIVSLVCPLDLLSTDLGSKKLLDKADAIWYPLGDDGDCIQSNFILIGAIENSLYLTTANLLLDVMMKGGYIADGAMLLAMQPLTIAGKKVNHIFKEYVPPESYFTPLEQKANLIKGLTSLPWPPRDKHTTSYSSGSHTHNRPNLRTQFDFDVLVGDSHSKFRFSMFSRTPKDDNDQGAAKSVYKTGMTTSSEAHVAKKSEDDDKHKVAVTVEP